MSAPRVRIHYLRPPDRLEVFEQALVHEGPGASVTLKSGLELARPMRIGERVVSESGAAIVWFTFPGLWHDVGRFHLADGTFTGLYANVLTPVEMGADHVWRTTDLFLDVWLDQEGARILDEDELEEAVARGWVDGPTAARARQEARAIVRASEAGTWPPAVVAEWTLARARAAVGG